MDIGCDDFIAAARNRRMVKLKQNIEGYLWIEAVIRGWPHNKPLPLHFYGHLPIVGKQEAREVYPQGIYEIDEEF